MQIRSRVQRTSHLRKSRWKVIDISIYDRYFYPNSTFSTLVLTEKRKGKSTRKEHPRDVGRQCRLSMHCFTIQRRNIYMYIYMTLYTMPKDRENERDRELERERERTSSIHTEKVKKDDERIWIFALWTLLHLLLRERKAKNSVYKVVGRDEKTKWEKERWVCEGERKRETPIKIAVESGSNTISTSDSCKKSFLFFPLHPFKACLKANLSHQLASRHKRASSHSRIGG